MKLKALIFLSFAILLANCEVTSEVPQIEAPLVLETKALDVTVCDLKNDPAKYNHKRVKLSGNFFRGFEVSSLYDPTCKSNQMIWVESADAMNLNLREELVGVEGLEVEGMNLRPLSEDTIFTKYDELLADGQDVKATVVGTFFSGKKTQFPGEPPRTFYTGYGHMGASSLFIVQEVLSAEPSTAKDKIIVE
jgi:hypothetical protein